MQLKAARTQNVTWGEPEDGVETAEAGRDQMEERCMMC
jgi:hypothetical protein